MLATAPYTPTVTAPSVTQPDARARFLRPTLLFAAAMYLVYLVVGWWLISVKHFIINDAMSKTLTAQLMVLSRDPHLANMGYYWMPLPMLIRIPFVLLLYPIHATVMAGPAASALMAALTLPVLHMIGRSVGAPRRATAVVVIAYGLSPVTVISAASGMAETTYGLFLALAVLGYVRWMRFGGVNHLAFFGIALAGAVLSRFESLLLLPIVAVVCSVASPKGRRLPTVLLATIPAVAAMGLFTLTSALIKRDPIFWWHAAQGPTTTPPNPSWLPDHIDRASMIKYGLVMVAVIAPAAYAVLAGALADRRRFWASLGLAGFVLVQPMAVVYQVLQGQSWATPRLFLFMAPLAAACAGLWLLRDADTNIYGAREDATPGLAWLGASRRLGYASVALIPIGALTATLYLADSDHSAPEGEYVFFQPLLGRAGWSDPVVLNRSNPVFTLDLEEFQQMMRDLDPELATGKVVAMDSLQGFPLLFTKHPKQFLVPEDRDFERILSDPIGRFEYIILLPNVNPSYAQVLLQRAIDYSGPEGRFVVMAEYAVGKVYEWVPATSANSAPSTNDTVPSPGT
jgi:hypothetical protein